MYCYRFGVQCVAHLPPGLVQSTVVFAFEPNVILLAQPQPVPLAPHAWPLPPMTQEFCSLSGTLTWACPETACHESVPIDIGGDSDVLANCKTSARVSLADLPPPWPSPFQCDSTHPCSSTPAARMFSNPA